MMEMIQNKTFDEERALYASNGLRLEHCSFDGPADGESALKESTLIEADHCFFNLRYPFWHVNGLKLSNSELTPLCRAALWYSHDLHITNTALHGIKALRECSRVTMSDCDVISPEFAWFVNGLKMSSCSAESEYFMLRCENVVLDDFTLKGKYSFQYLHNATLSNCTLNTKDAFWHAENVVIRNCTVNGEYLAWYSNNLTFENCRISGTQPFCYCKGLKLINCELTDADLAFEKSEVEATLTTPVISIKNAYSGHIRLPYAEEIIHTDSNARAQIIQTEG